jgi:hypothetical protein
MAWGSGDIIRDEREGRIEAVNLLLAVAMEEKTVADVRAWLEKEYPELCVKDEKVKKW